MSNQDNGQTAQSLPSETQLSRMLQGYRYSQLIYVAAKLGIADLLKDGPKHSDELAGSVGAEAQALKRFLRGLVRLGVVVEGQDGRFALTSLGVYLRAGVPGSLYEVAILIGEVLYPAWGDLLHTVRTGKTAFEYAFGMKLFQYLSQNPETGERFNNFMVSLTTDIAEAVVEAYNFLPFDRIVDVGGGYGVLISAILKANPHLAGILFDIPAVITDVGQHIEAAGLADRCEAIAGDCLVSVPDGGDVYLISQVLHVWDDEHCLRVLKNCRTAIKERGTLLVIEQVMPEPVDRSTGAVSMDLMMMMLTGGRERTENDYRTLFTSTGFQLARIIPTQTNRSIIEAIPS